MTSECQDDKGINAQSALYRLDVNCFNLQQSINQRIYSVSTLQERCSRGERERGNSTRIRELENEIRKRLFKR